MKKTTRRTFVAMLGFGAATLVVGKRAGAQTLGPPQPEPVADREPALPRWIGHC